jgi:hypothetical protein
MAAFIASSNGSLVTGFRRKATAPAAVLYAGFITRRHDDCWNSQPHARKAVQELQSRHILHLQIDDQTGGDVGVQGIEEVAARLVGLNMERIGPDDAR